MSPSILNNGGYPRNVNFIPKMHKGQGINYNHPLSLIPAYISGVNLISFQLLRTENYTLRSRSIRIALLCQNEIGLIDGSCKIKLCTPRAKGSMEEG